MTDERWGWNKFSRGAVGAWSVTDEIANKPQPAATKDRSKMTLSELVALRTKEALAAAAKAKAPAPWGPFARGGDNGR